MKKPAPVLTLEQLIKRRLLRHIEGLRFKTLSDGALSPISNAKSRLRKMHKHQRDERLRSAVEFVKHAWPRFKNYFANGVDVDPTRVQPRIELVLSDTWQSDLFRLAALTWRIPVSQGYGRRLRFLVWDHSNGKLLGLIGLGDPVFNMRVRDQSVGWNIADREQRLVNVLDAYVLGAVPPYNMVLGGKMVASLLRTKEIRRIFARKYGHSKGIISGKRKKPSLVLITTTSSLGRSSIFNRVALHGERYLESVGYTSGWGHFHIPDDLFLLVRRFLSARDHKYADGNKFGDGPSWKLRAMRQALNLVGLKDRLLHHGIAREVFVCWLASNGREILTGQQKRPKVSHVKSVKEVGELARERWVIPRAKHREEYKMWRRSSLRRCLNPPKERKKTKLRGRRYGTG